MPLLRSDDEPINSALVYINSVNHVKQDNGVYITKEFLDGWNGQYSPYTLERGYSIYKNTLFKRPDGSYGFNNKIDPIDNIYLKKNTQLIATFNYNGTNFYLETEGGANKKTKNVKSKRRTKRSKRTKRKHTRKYRMK
jgi:hypothetical protein